MRVEIHDVDHGGCTVITGPWGHRLMLDCGHSADRPWFPSIAYRGQRFETLMLLNLDEDHCEDLPYLWRDCPLGGIVSNPTVTVPALRAMKAKSGMRAGVAKAAEIFESHGHGFIGNWSHNLGGVQWHAFWNRYGIDFADTNNLSLAVFMSFGGFTILFGGDLEKEGWRKLLLIPGFRQKLTTTKIYVASHHGRDNGCCDELLKICQPELVIFSDGAKQYQTQETRSWYAGRATGIINYLAPASPLSSANALRLPMRKVMTTRRDGTITVDVGTDGRYVVTPTKALPQSGLLSSMSATSLSQSLSGLGVLSSLSGR
ncbi:MAG: hypothetical protein P4L57_06460 [Rhizomicrobium sp.]|nr:hypothetical protein [Rhizomicrobium sp.]